jgi:hypothetical protein
VKNNSRIARLAVLASSIAIPVVLLTAAGISHVRAQPPSFEPGELAGKSKHFKNIKVLKNLPADRLIPTMHDWNTALGVECGFCHVVAADHTGFEKDDKPAKNMARQMVTMAMDLNKHQKILGEKVTCYMCHHGRQEPETRPRGEGGERREPTRR